MEQERDALGAVHWRGKVLAAAFTALTGTVACGGQSTVASETKPDPSSSPDAGDSGVEPGPVDDLACDLAATACGSDPVGTWKVMDCPLELTGAVDVSALGLGCAFGETISGNLEVSGTLTLDATGLFWDDTHTQGVHEFSLPAACMQVPLVSGCASIGLPLANTVYATAECVDDPATGGCTCSGTFDQRGGLADISLSAGRMARYFAEGGQLTLGDEKFGTTYDYCAMDGAMILTLSGSNAAGQVLGSIVLQEQ